MMMSLLKFQSHVTKMTPGNKLVKTLKTKYVLTLISNHFQKIKLHAISLTFF
jgi:hypothetical protein